MAAHCAGRLFGRVQWKMVLIQLRIFSAGLCQLASWQKKTNVAEPPQASLLKEITSVSNSQENNTLYVKTVSTVLLPSQDTHPVQWSESPILCPSVTYRNSLGHTDVPDADIHASLHLEPLSSQFRDASPEFSWFGQSMRAVSSSPSLCSDLMKLPEDKPLPPPFFIALDKPHVFQSKGSLFSFFIHMELCIFLTCLV